MKILSVIILQILLLCSCEQTYKVKNSDLIGDWVRLTYHSNNDTSEFRIPPPPEVPFGHSFFSDSLEFFSGYYKFIPDTINYRRNYIFCGYLFPYKIINNKIFIINKCEENHIQYEILRYSRDSLFVRDETNTMVFLRLKPKKETNFDFDKIVFSTSGCYGECPIMDIVLNNNRKLTFFGYMYTDRIGMFEGELDSTEYNKIISYLQKSQPSTLEVKYDAGHTDDEEISITFWYSDNICGYLRKCKKQNSINCFYRCLTWW